MKWESPSGDGSNEPPPPQQWGQPPPPQQWGQPPPPQQWGQPAQPGTAYGYGPGYGYSPPPIQPGVVPLRPLGLSEILDGAVQTIRQNPKVMLGLSAVVNLILGVTVALVQLSTLRSAFATLDDPESSDSTADSAAQLLSSLLAVVLQFVGTTVLTGLLVIAVSDAVLGRRPSVREVWDRARGRIWALLGVTVLILLTLLGVAVVALLPGVLVLIGGNGLAGGLLLAVGIIGALVAAAWIGIRLLFAPPTVLLERTGVGTAMRRSWRLVGGSWWRCFGIVLLAELLASVLSGVLQLPFIVAGLVAGSAGWSAVAVILTVIGGIIARTLIAPFSAAILVLLYIDLRMRREGLDVTLQRAVSTPTP